MSRRALAACAAAACLLLSGCERNKLRGYQRTVGEAVPRIEAGVGVKFKTPPVIEERSKEEVAAFIARELADTARLARLAAHQSVYKMLGVIPDSLDLRKLTADLLTEQVLGYYDPKTKVLYVVKGAPRANVGLIIWHELVHALQDQYVNVDSLLSQPDNDRATAAQALLEGEASLEQIQAFAGPDNANAATAMFSNWEKTREVLRQNKQIMPAYSASPFFVQEQLLFPYLSGAEFVRHYKDSRAGKPPFLATIPASTEQIVSRAAYFGATKDEPLTITLPAPKGAATRYEDVLGEFEIRLFVFEHLQSQEEAVTAAAGWGGDRYQVLRTPKGDGLAWITMWDTPLDAVEFLTSLQHIVGVRYPDAKGVGVAGASHATRYDTYARSIVVQGTDGAGHAAVIYIDVPRGTSTDVVNLANVRASR
ncbi:MAG: hypothetical protein ABJD07_11750 [Gemmatimonadaceae bacterium]